MKKEFRNYFLYSKANNKYMKKYNITETLSYIVYWDTNNLYGHTMIQNLPYGEIELYDFGAINELNKQYESYKMTNSFNKVNNFKKSCNNPLHAFINNLNEKNDDVFLLNVIDTIQKNYTIIIIHIH